MKGSNYWQCVYFLFVQGSWDVNEWSLTSVHCPWVCTMRMTHGSDLFSVSLSSKALQETRSSTLETQVAGPPRLAAGEVASWMSFILDGGGARGSVAASQPTNTHQHAVDCPGEQQKGCFDRGDGQRRRANSSSGRVALVQMSQREHKRSCVTGLSLKGRRLTAISACQAVSSTVTSSSCTSYPWRCYESKPGAPASWLKSQLDSWKKK